MALALRGPFIYSAPQLLVTRRMKIAGSFRYRPAAIIRLSERISRPAGHKQMNETPSGGVGPHRTNPIKSNWRPTAHTLNDRLELHGTDTMNQQPSSGGKITIPAGSMDCCRSSLSPCWHSMARRRGKKIPAGAHAAHPGGGGIGQRRRPEESS
jgi:hypothetical protein